MPEMKSIAEQNPVEVPLYTTLDAARYLRVPVWVIFSAFGRPPHHPMDFFERLLHERPVSPRTADDYGPILPEEEGKRLSFRTLAALFAFTGVFRPLLPELPYTWRHPKDYFHFFEQTHRALRDIENDPRVFTDPNWVLNRHGRFFERLPEDEVPPLLKQIALHQARVDLKAGVPVRLYPFSRDPAPDAPRVVVIDPELRFGRPTVKGAPTDVLAERWRAGDNSADLADDYGLTTDEVDEALRYEASPYHPLALFPFPPFGW